MKRLFTAAAILTIAGAAISAPAFAQANVQDISVQLQSSLEANTPTIVYFDFDKDNITPDMAAILQQQSSWLLQNPDAKVNLAGHTDAVGTNEYNDDLAMRRANAVQQFLFDNGVSPAQMQSVVSRGEYDLAVSTTERERLNRRVTTSVTGLVQLVAAPPPPPPPVVPTPVRTYTEDTTPVCDGRSRTTLATADIKALGGELESRMNAAAAKYNDPAVQGTTGPGYNLAGYTKVQCGIALGYTKKGIVDERSVNNCDCSSNLLASQG
ncbi:MAG: OmpA family protein [Acidimicrobiales bacterium]|nr:OmpA family protein [Hyphomonadaceae bacterium]RZV44529.1 MAG: OmpA family protein [Acidimicrobiales bacterium]